VNQGFVFFFHTELCHVDQWFNTEQELWYSLGSWCFGSAQNLAVLCGNFLIHQVVIHLFENLKTYAVNHNKFCYSLQHMLHVSVITDHPQELNAWYLKLEINCICIEFAQILFICICVFVSMHASVCPSLMSLYWKRQIDQCKNAEMIGHNIGSDVSVEVAEIM
jgi:hypothetical protein